MIIVSNNVNQATITQVNTGNSLATLPKIKSNFLSVSELQKKCFIQANHPVWNYIVNCNELSVSEKLLYLAIDVDSKMLDGEEKLCEFPASKIAKELGLSKRLILHIQKSLEKKGYLFQPSKVAKSLIQNGQNDLATKFLQNLKNPNIDTSNYPIVTQYINNLNKGGTEDDPEVLELFFLGSYSEFCKILGGNQNDSVDTLDES